MTVRIYRSTDYAAPDIGYGLGSLTSALNLILVDGYGDQVVSITRVGTTATVTTPLPHGIVVRAKMNISGADQPEYNGEHDIFVTGLNEFEFTVDAAAISPATGVITSRISGAGWTKTEKSVNNFAYTQGGAGMSLHIDDNVNLNLAYVYASESIHTDGSPIDRFPIEQLYCIKSQGSTTARDWILVATEVCFHLHIIHYQYNNSSISSFGDFNSVVPADTKNTLIQFTTNTNQYAGYFHSMQQSFTQASSGAYYARDYLNNRKSIPCSRSSAPPFGKVTMGLGYMDYPNPIDGKLYTSEIRLAETTGVYRGEMKGLVVPLHDRPLTHNDIFDGIGALAGKTYLVIDFSGQVFFEISDTW